MDIFKMSKMDFGNFRLQKTHEKCDSLHYALLFKIVGLNFVTDTFWTFLSGLDIFVSMQSVRFSDTILF